MDAECVENNPLTIKLGEGGGLKIQILQNKTLQKHKTGYVDI